MTGRRGACALVVLVLGCKSRALVAAETYERVECACWHHDLACARAARSAFVDVPTPRTRWYEREPADEIFAHEEAGEACYARAILCGDADPCGADRRCVPDAKNPSREHCVRLAREGESCNGVDEDVCGEGLICWSDDPLAHSSGVCDDPSCAMLVEGVCVKPASASK